MTSMILFASLLAAHATPVPVVVDRCDLRTAGIEASGMASLSASVVVVVDDSNDMLYTLDTTNCRVLNSVDTFSATGTDRPSGVTYLPAQDQIAIVNRQHGDVHFFARDLSYQMSCTPSGAVVDNPSGLSYRGSTDELLIADAPSRTVVTLDATSCAGAVSQALPPTASSPRSLAATADGYAVVDDVGDRIRFVGPNGQVDEAARVSATVEGIPLAVSTVEGSHTWHMATDSKLFTVDLSGSTSETCPLPAAVGNARGVSYNAASDQFVVIDDVPRLYFIDATTCRLLRQIGLPNQFDIDEGSGVTFMQNGEVAVVEGSTSTIHYVDETTGAQLDTCRTRPLGLTDLSGTAFLPGFNDVAVVSEDGRYGITSLQCDATFLRSTTFDQVESSRTPLGTAYGRSLGQIFVADDALDEILVSDLRGRELLAISMEDLRYNDVQGLTSRDASRLYAMDATDDVIVELDLPVLATVAGIGGWYANANGSISMDILANEAGLLSGVASQGARRFELFGRWDAASRTVTLVVELPTGTQVLQGTASPDLSAIDFGGGIGVFTR